jgi:hypothetical protein
MTPACALGAGPRPARRAENQAGMQLRGPGRVGFAGGFRQSGAHPDGRSPDAARLEARALLCAPEVILQALLRQDRRLLVNLRGNITVILPDCDVPIGAIAPEKAIVIWREGSAFGAGLRRDPELAKTSSEVPSSAMTSAGSFEPPPAEAKDGKARDAPSRDDSGFLESVFREAFEKTSKLLDDPKGGDLAPSTSIILHFGPHWQRREEVARMTWEALDLHQRVWTLPKTRTNNAREHAVHLSEQSMAVLKRTSVRGPSSSPSRGPISDKVAPERRSSVARLCRKIWAPWCA